MRRTRFARLIRVAINGFERTGVRRRGLMLLPIEGQKVEGIGPVRLKRE